MADNKFAFAERHFRISGSDVQLTGKGDYYIYLKADSELVSQIKDWTLAASTAEYIQTESVYAGQFTDDEAFLIATAARNAMAELNYSEGEAIDEAVSEYKVYTALRKGRAA